MVALPAMGERRGSAATGEEEGEGWGGGVGGHVGEEGRRWRAVGGEMRERERDKERCGASCPI